MGGGPITLLSTIILTNGKQISLKNLYKDAFSTLDNQSGRTDNSLSYHTDNIGDQATNVTCSMIHKFGFLDLFQFSSSNSPLHLFLLFHCNVSILARCFYCFTVLLLLYFCMTPD